MTVKATAVDVWSLARFEVWQRVKDRILAVQTVIYRGTHGQITRYSTNIYSLLSLLLQFCCTFCCLFVLLFVPFSVVLSLLPSIFIKRNNFIIPYNPIISTVSAYYIVKAITLYSLSQILQQQSKHCQLLPQYIAQPITLSTYTIYLHNKQQLYNKQYTP